MYIKKSAKIQQFLTNKLILENLVSYSYSTLILVVVYMALKSNPEQTESDGQRSWISNPKRGDQISSAYSIFILVSFSSQPPFVEVLGSQLLLNGLSFSPFRGCFGQVLFSPVFDYGFQKRCNIALEWKRGKPWGGKDPGPIPGKPTRGSS